MSESVEGPGLNDLGWMTEKDRRFVEDIDHRMKTASDILAKDDQVFFHELDKNAEANFQIEENAGNLDWDAIRLKVTTLVDAFNASTPAGRHSLYSGIKLRLGDTSEKILADKERINEEVAAYRIFVNIVEEWTRQTKV